MGASNPQFDPGHRMNRRLCAAVCAACGCLVAALCLLDPRLVHDARLNAGDVLVRMVQPPPFPFPTAFIGLDPSSVELDGFAPEEIEANPVLQLMAKGYPFSREVWATAIDRLASAGARAILLDVLLVGARDGDEALRDVLQKTPTVIVSAFLEDASGDGTVTGRYQMPAESLEPPPHRVGFATFWRDQDSKVRTAPFYLDWPGTDEPARSAPLVLLELLDAPRAASLPPQAPILFDRTILEEPVLPLWKIIDDTSWTPELQRFFRGRVVAIGAFHPTFRDEFQTPIGVIPGFKLHIATLSAAWSRAFYRLPTPGEAALAALLGAFVAWLATVLVPNIFLRAALVLLAAGSAIAAGVLLLSQFGFLAPLLGYWAGLGLAWTGALTVDIVRETGERRRTRNVLERYVSSALAREILDHRSEFLQALGGIQKDVTVAFVDVRGFTRLAEGLPPSELVTELNRFFGRMTELVLESGGSVDKFLGDGFLATWGTLGRRSPAEESQAALACVEKMLSALDSFNQRRRDDGLFPWKIGVGLHSGPVIFGNVGSLQKMEPTVLGDTVNLASRIEGLTKAYGVAALASSSLAPPDWRPVDTVRVVGKAIAVELWTPWPPDCGNDFRNLHHSALAAYRSGHFENALTAFEQLPPDDGPAEFFRSRCREFLKAPPADWDGITTAASK